MWRRVVWYLVAVISEESAASEREAEGSSVTLERNYQTARRHIPEDSDVHKVDQVITILRRHFILSGSCRLWLFAATPPRVWAVDLAGQVNTVNEPTRSGSWWFADKIMTLINPYAAASKSSRQTSSCLATPAIHPPSVDMNDMRVSSCDSDHSATDRPSSQSRTAGRSIETDIF